MYLYIRTYVCMYVCMYLYTQIWLWSCLCELRVLDKVRECYVVYEFAIVLSVLCSLVLISPLVFVC